MSSTADLAKNITSKLIDDIEAKIENEVIMVAPDVVDLDTIIQEREVKKAKKAHKKHVQPTIEEIAEIKQSKIIELRQIQKKEEQLKKSAILNQSKISKKLWKSDFTEQDIKQINKILKKQRQYQQQLRKKQQNLQQWLALKHHQDEELKKQEMAQQSQQRRKQLIKQREELSKKKQQRALEYEEQIRKIKQLKTKKLLHDKMSESWKRYEQACEKERDQAHQLNIQRCKVDLKDIQEHETKYLEMKRQQEQKRLEEGKNSKFRLPYIHSHAQIFYRAQKEEQQRIKEEEMKLKTIEDNIAKKKEYSKHVNDVFLPKTTLSAEKTNHPSLEKLHVSMEQLHKIGNDYMKQAHQKIDRSQPIKEKQAPPADKAGISAYYKNYLQEVKPQLKENRGNMMEQVEQALKSSKLSEADKLHKVKLFFEKGNGARSGDMVEVIRKKMKVLNEIME